jgi:mannitol-1-phosphate 5-dehydrogenase
MSTFLGIGFGPIQTGIFLSGACAGGFDEIVIAEVDDSLKKAINGSDGGVTVNIAGRDEVRIETMAGIKLLNPRDSGDLAELIGIAARADEIATALPSVSIFPSIAGWLGEGFAREPNRRRFVYTAENHNHAAELLADAVGRAFPKTHYLNTVVGKMSGVVKASECASRGLKPLCPIADRGHLVEEFDRIFISSVPGIESREIRGLHVKADLYPFEEAKLYGHNAIHYLLGILGSRTGKQFMSELAADRELMALVRDAFIEESGAALCRKWAGTDELFTARGFQEYADDLLVRMTNPFLQDTIERIVRDPARKLGWNDRVVGTIRLALSQDVTPTRIARGAAVAARELFGDNPATVRDGLRQLWDLGPADATKGEAVLDLVIPR